MIANMEKCLNAIKQNSVTLFVRSYCPYCKRAERLFEELNIKATIIDFGTIENGEEVKEELAKMTGHRTVPMIFINGKFVGGCDTVTKLHEESKLISLVNNQ